MVLDLGSAVPEGLEAGSVATTSGALGPFGGSRRAAFELVGAIVVLPASPLLRVAVPTRLRLCPGNRG